MDRRVFETMSSGSSVADFYSDRNVLITGATGFMGKVLVEKLLRSCPGVKTIYLLMRSKGSQDVTARLQEMLGSKLFDNIRKSNAQVLSKLVAVEGDITLPELGLSPKDTKMLAENVSVVFHAAATVKFDEALKLSLQMNVLGTIRMVELCHKMDKLVALIHVSTAYCNCDRQEVKEIVYPPPMDPYKLIQLVDWMDDDVFNHLTPKLIGKRPNTYTFTKALAEYALVQESGSLPVTIVRPSIVCAAWREPIAGWVDNLNGPTGLIVGAGKGMLRTFYCNSSITADIIPVDVPINLMIVSAWYTASHRRENVKVFNCVSGAECPITWGEFQAYGMRALKINVLNDIIWYPSLSFTKHKFVNTVGVVFKHWIPAYILDFVARFSGRRPIMVRVVKKLARAADCLEYFTTHEWNFCNDNVQSLWQNLSEADQHTFNFSLSTIDWQTYLHQYCLGSKRYVMKEDLSTLPAARKRLNKMWWLQQAFRMLAVLIAWRLVMLRSATARRAYSAYLRMLIRMLTYLPLLDRI
ncbi:putative fatty acyl-CoA reductase [Armadillidium nasatum]|uniref:Fatty acyl-CoA reductase n=1 Tax=Armadillidium nasatum TaxID=96803 RepID=A0A5N5TPC6_9CRUS|nr:putative fatty acyl-CoA reductase [Armadillidium nasatum]